MYEVGLVLFYVGLVADDIGYTSAEKAQ